MPGPTCTTVRGKPSRMKPTRQSGRCTASPISPTTISSDTSAPASMAFFACSSTFARAGSATGASAEGWHAFVAQSPYQS